MKKPALLLSTFFWVFFIYHSSFSQESYLLKYDLKKGKIYLMSDSLSQSTTYKGNKINISSNISHKCEWKIDSIDKLNIYHITSNLIEAINYGNKLKKRRDEIVKLSILVDEFGNIRKTSKLNSVVKKNDWMVSTTSLPKLPNTYMKIGEKWNDTTTVKIPPDTTNSIKFLSEFTLIKMENFNGKDCLKIAFTQKSNFFKIDIYDTSIETIGTFYFDFEERIVTKFEYTTNTKMINPNAITLNSSKDRSSVEFPEVISKSHNIMTLTEN